MSYLDPDKQREYQRQWYHKTKELPGKRMTRKDSKKNLIERNRQTILEAKTTGCQICGYNKCADSLEFHHRDPNTKELTISAAVRAWGPERLKEELSKCIILCANCHRELHFNLKQGNTNENTRP